MNKLSGKLCETSWGAREARCENIFYWHQNTNTNNK